MALVAQLPGNLLDYLEQLNCEALRYALRNMEVARGEGTNAKLALEMAIKNALPMQSYAFYNYMKATALPQVTPEEIAAKAQLVKDRQKELQAVVADCNSLMQIYFNVLNELTAGKAT